MVIIEEQHEYVEIPYASFLKHLFSFRSAKVQEDLNTLYNCTNSPSRVVRLKKFKKALKSKFGKTEGKDRANSLIQLLSICQYGRVIEIQGKKHFLYNNVITEDHTEIAISPDYIFECLKNINKVESDLTENEELKIKRVKRNNQEHDSRRLGPISRRAEDIKFEKMLKDLISEYYELLNDELQDDLTECIQAYINAFSEKRASDIPDLSNLCNKYLKGDHKYSVHELAKSILIRELQS